MGALPIIASLLGVPLGYIGFYIFTGGRIWGGVARLLLMLLVGPTIAGGGSLWFCAQNPSMCRCWFWIFCSPPSAKLIDPLSISPTASTSDPNLVKFKIQFSQAVTGVDDKDFALIPDGSVKDFELKNVAPENANTDEDTYMASVNIGTGDGTIRLDLKDDDSIKSIQEAVPLGGDGVGNGDFQGQEYSIPPKNTTPAPSVVSIKPVDPIFTNQPEVSYYVQFSQNVTGIDLSDFQLTSQPVMSGAQLSRWQEQSPSLYRIFVTTGSENHNKGDCFQLKLTLKDDDSIKNSEGTPLGGTGVDNEVASGEINSQVVCGAWW